jgi:hypothetical protein
MSDVGNYDITIKQGETWDLNLELKDDEGTAIDLTGYDVEMKIKNDYDSYVIEELSIDNGKVDNESASTGNMGFRLNPADTKKFKFEYAIYDIKFTDPLDNVQYMIQGSVTVKRSVTL